MALLLSTTTAAAIESAIRLSGGADCWQLLTRQQRVAAIYAEMRRLDATAALRLRTEQFPDVGR